MDAFRSRSIALRQAGAVLLVTIVLLALASLITLFAVNVGMFEQRSTGNDVRAKAVNEAAEAGLAQGFEYLMRQHADMLNSSGLWEKCTATDDTFPCGAIKGTFAEDDDGDPTTPMVSISRRSTMYRLKADASNTITDIDPALSQYMLALPTASKIAALNGSDVAYGVAPVLCMVRRPAHAGASGIACGDGTGTGATSIRVATFVSVAKLAGESASSTLVQTVGQYPKLGDDVLSRPSITTSGSAGVTGTLQVVTNPNGGGPGVPVSVWTRVNVDKTGTTNTCYADEFFRYTQGNTTPVPYQGTIRCDDCRCDANGAPPTLSYDASGSLQAEGIDVLDVDAGTNSTTGYHVGGQVGVNYNVRSDALSYPLCEFPPDLFKYVFGPPTWDDTDHDCFGETKLASVIYANPDNPAAWASIGPDEAFLYKSADRVIAKPANVALLKVGQAGTTALLAASSSHGMIWCQHDCDIASGVQVGTPSAPVILILDGPVRIHGTIFGLVYIRDTGSQLSPTTGSSLTGACPSDCMLQMESGAAIYGALVVQGQMKSNGTSAVIHDDTVLGAVITQAGLVYATLPGAWTDQRAY